MSISPFEHPFLSGLLGHDDVSRCFDVAADLKAMLSFEVALADAQVSVGVIPVEAAAAIKMACLNFDADMEGLKRGAARDGVVVPELVRQLRATMAEEHASYLHFGATSQDVIDTSLVLRLKQVCVIIEATLERVIGQIDKLEVEFGEVPLIGRTRMQRALPITVSRRLNNWKMPLKRQLEKMAEQKTDLFKLQFGGAVGTLDKFGETGPDIRKKLAELLALGDPEGCWHTDRTSLANFANWLSGLSGALGKIGQDIALMAINEVAEITLGGGGGSSAMPGKQNPVKAELLVTLSRFNAMNMSGMHQALIHENERSGSSWTLEWMVLPQMIMTTSASLRLCDEMLESIESF